MQPPRQSSSPETPYGIHIRNIVFDASEANLKEAFEHYGPVQHSFIARDARGMSRGYGFVFFETEDAMNNAIAEANGSFWHGRRLTVQTRKKTSPAGGYRPSVGMNEPSSTLFVGNLPYETTDADLNNLFNDLAGLRNVRVAVDRATGWPRGFAHADFASVDDAKAAMAVLKDKQVGNRTLRLDYSAGSRNANAEQSDAQKGVPAESAMRT